LNIEKAKAAAFPTAGGRAKPQGAAAEQVREVIRIRHGVGNALVPGSCCLKWRTSSGRSIRGTIYHVMLSTRLKIQEPT